jgi:hypothetical protein
MVAVLAGCGGAKLSAPECTVDGTRFAVGPGWSEATGQHTIAIELTNTAAQTCALKGYPQLRAFGAGGVELPLTYRDHGDQMITSRPPHEVVVRPGGHAAFVVNKYRCDVHATGYATTLAVALPGSRAARLVGLPGGSRTLDFCSERPSIQVDVTPILADGSQASAHA